MSISTSESSSVVRRWSLCAKATTAMSLLDGIYNSSLYESYSASGSPVGR